MQYDTNVAIIGGGICGLAIGAFLSPNYHSILLERNPHTLLETSSHNSGVIHAGLYYRPGSLKAVLCNEGRGWLYDHKNELDLRKTGKLIIAANEDEVRILLQKKENASCNGVDLGDLLNKNDIQKIQPNIKAHSALYSPETGIIDVHSLAKLYVDMRDKNEYGRMPTLTNSKVVGIESLNPGFRVNYIDSHGNQKSLTSEVVVNAAGLCSDLVTNMLGKDITQRFTKGDYWTIKNEVLPTEEFNVLVYPVPQERGLGIHLTFDLGGRILLGPNVIPLEPRPQVATLDTLSTNSDFLTDPEHRYEFFNAATVYLPFIKSPDEITEADAGIRPQFEGVKSDFVIEEMLPGFVCLVGIESPGLTASPAIGRYVRGVIENITTRK
ncbi:NAD(P)/FAD-dependent oxidoreductase [Nanoarchaeota archaeon]